MARILPKRSSSQYYAFSSTTPCQTALKTYNTWLPRKIAPKLRSSRIIPQSANTFPSTDPFSSPPTSDASSSGDRSHETDIVVIGSGIGGLCAAALLARYGYKVTVCEAHYHAGGAAHGFEVKGFHFDAGPSFFAGMSGPPGESSNPLKQVLDAVCETVDYVTYDGVRKFLFPGAPLSNNNCF